MGLKFRRGTTAQQSGSLAFGEPYVNTTLGTLVVGGPNGDIILSSTGTGSTGTFGAISGSGLDISGNANIAGNLTLGGQLTIGDNTSDTVNVVASLSSSLIPQTANTYDLGSAAKFWKDLYISTGSIKFVDNGGNVVGTLTGNASGDLKITGELSGSSIAGLGNATAFSTSVNSRIVTNANSAAGAFASASAFSASAAVVAQSNANSAAGAFASASAYSASAAVVAQSNANSAAGAFTSASAYSASAATDLNGLSSSVATTINNASSSAFSTFAKLSGGNTFNGTQTITGSLFVSANLIVQGSSSLQNITASAVSIGTNTVILNTDAPSVRFGGIKVIDSGSSSATGSLLWDSENNVWLYTNPGGVGYVSAKLISGPQNTGSLGNEPGLTLGKVPVAVGDDHIGDSIISASATKVTIAGDLDVTGNSNINGIGDASTFSASVNSRIVTNTNAAAGAFASASAYSSSQFTRDAGQDTLITANSASAWGAFQSASAYSASAAVIDNAQTTNITANSASAAGAFASASAYSASAFTAYAKLGAANTFTANQIVSGSITATGDVVAFSTSDKRHKHNIVLISDALSKVTKLNGVTWEWNEDVDDATKQTPKTGLIAQEVQEVLPEVVKERGDGFLALDYSKTIGLLVEAIKEQQTQIHSLTLEIEKLKKNNSL